jgi:site-specific DNA recombinase
MAPQHEAAEADEKLARLYRLVEDGLTDLDDVLRGRLDTLKMERDRAKAALERAKQHSASQIRVDPALVERFSRLMKENFATGSAPFRKAYMQSLIVSIEVDDGDVPIKGSKDLLENAVLATQSRPSGCSQMSTRWRASQNKDANTYVIVIPL